MQNIFWFALTSVCVQAAGSQEVWCEVDVDVTEEEQDVLPLSPGPGADVEASAARKLLIHLDQGETPEPSLPEAQDKTSAIAS